MRLFSSRITDSSRTDSDRPDSSRTDSNSMAQSGPDPTVRLVEGAKAGLVGTVTMTAYRLPVSRSLPPTARFWAKFVSGGDPDDHLLPAAALHLLYGTVAGVVFGLLASISAGATSDEDGQSPESDSRTDSTEDARQTARLEAVGLLTGVLYALGLSIFGERVMLERLLDVDLAPDERLVFHAGHVVYGLSLGTWFGSRTGDRQ